MTTVCILKRALGVCLLALFCGGARGGAEWPTWGGTPSRNMCSNETGLPDFFAATLPGDAAATSSGAVLAGPPVWPTKSGLGGKNLRWVARLATKSFGSPVVAGGKVFIGANSETHYDPRRNERGGGSMLCLDDKSGRLLWQLIVPRYLTHDPLFNYDIIGYGVLSTPVVEGKRVYFVTNRDELVCCDTRGMANGNDGPYKDEAHLVGEGQPPITPGPLDGDILWRVDMLHDPEVNAWVQDADDCSVLLLGNYLYCCPSNGVNSTHKVIPHPNCPSLIVVDKRTGKIVARDDARIGPHIIHGEWSSPAYGVVNGKPLIFWGGGDGAVWAFAAKPTPPAPGERLGRLKVVWRFDVNAAAGRIGPYRTVSGPSEIIATPVFYKNRVYVDIGQDPTHGRGRGALACIDATGTGDITKSGKRWVFKDIDRSLSTVAIADGLLYAADNSGQLFCLDADTGRQYAKQVTNQSICSSPLVADGKLYIGTDSGWLWIFKADRGLKLINKIHLDSTIESTCAAAGGTLYVSTQHYLYAAKKP